MQDPFYMFSPFLPLPCSCISVLAYFPSSQITVHYLESSFLRAGFPFGEHVCHVLCSHPYCILSRLLLTVKYWAGLVQGRGNLSGPVAGLFLLCATWLGPWNGRCRTMPGVPVLSPSRPGSVTVTCAEAGFLLFFQGLWQLLQLWGGSQAFPPTPAFKGDPSSTSQQCGSCLLWMSPV